MRRHFKSTQCVLPKPFSFVVKGRKEEAGRRLLLDCRRCRDPCRPFSLCACRQKDCAVPSGRSLSWMVAEQQRMARPSCQGSPWTDLSFALPCRCHVRVLAEGWIFASALKMVRRRGKGLSSCLAEELIAAYYRTGEPSFHILDIALLHLREGLWSAFLLRILG